MRSEKLMRFPSSEVPTRTKDIERQRLENEINEYLARGGQIAQCTAADSAFNQPKRTRRERKRDWVKNLLTYDDQTAINVPSA